MEVTAIKAIQQTISPRQPMAPFVMGLNLLHWEALGSLGAGAGDDPRVSFLKMATQPMAIFEDYPRHAIFTVFPVWTKAEESLAVHGERFDDNLVITSAPESDIILRDQTGVGRRRNVRTTGFPAPDVTNPKSPGITRNE